MDFDPGELYDEGYEDGYDEGYEAIEEDTEDQEDSVELDAMGSPVYLAAAAGFGYHMAQDELNERQLAENIIKRKETPIKVALSHRHEKTGGGHMTPFARWSTKVNLDRTKINDEIEYTLEEKLQIFKSEGDWDG